MARKQISKKRRFDVFKRDGFICQYCGNAPPAVILEIDHVIPVAEGGDNDEDNLVTSCFECNRGKGAEPLSVAPKSIAEKAEEMQEAEDQIAAYTKLLSAKKRRENRAVNTVARIFKESFGRPLSKVEMHSIRSAFIPKLTADDIEHSMLLACSRIDSPDRAWKYFCGICWNKINKTYG